MHFALPILIIVEVFLAIQFHLKLEKYFVHNGRKRTGYLFCILKQLGPENAPNLENLLTLYVYVIITLYLLIYEFQYTDNQWM